jgi:hypothetical protein
MNILKRKRTSVINKIPETVCIDNSDIEIRGFIDNTFPLRADIKRIVGTYRKMVKEFGLWSNGNMKAEICCGWDNDAEKMIYVIRCHHYAGKENEYIGKSMCCYSEWHPSLIGGCWSYSVWLRLYKTQMILSDYIKEINKYLEKYFPDVPTVTDNLLYSWVLICEICPDEADEAYKKSLMQDKRFEKALSLYKEFWKDHAELYKAIKDKTAFRSKNTEQCVYIKGFISK